MGLPLRNPSSFPPLTSGSTLPGGPSVSSAGADSDPDLDPSEPLCHRNRKFHRHHHRDPHRACRTTFCCLGLESQCNRVLGRPHQRKLHHRLRQHHRPPHHYHHPAYAAVPLVAETHRVKPHNPWPADADEGCALARSCVRLPGENGHRHEDGPPEQRERQSGRSRRSRSCSSSGSSQSSSSSSSSRGRPPSLERQDAFRDEKTVKVKRRRGCGGATSTATRAAAGRDERCLVRRDSGGDDDDDDDDEKKEIAELYHMGLLYDDEYERGEGFSLDKIVREEPVYSLRVRPAKRGRRDEKRDDYAALSLDLAFSAFGEDEALAGWLISGSSAGSRGTALDLDAPAPRAWIEAMHVDTPRLTVIYELADDAVSAMSVDDFLDDVLVSEVSYCGGEDERAWAMLDGCNGNENAVPRTATNEDDMEVDPWVVLGHDGS